MYQPGDGNNEVFYLKEVTATFSLFTEHPKVIKFHFAVLINSLISCNTGSDAHNVWCRLEDLSASYNQSGASVTIEIIPEDIQDLLIQHPTTVAAPILFSDFTSSDCELNGASVDSITSILLPWYPQTLASVEKQKNAVKGLLTSCHEVGWHVIMRLMTHGTSTTAGIYKPKYLHCDIPEDIQVSTETYNDLCCYYINLAVDLAGSSIGRLESLSEASYHMSQQSFLNYLNMIIKACNCKLDHEKYVLWIKLSDVKFRIILNNEKIEPENECYSQLCETIDLIEPRNIFYKYQSLYLSKFNMHSLNDGFDWKKKTQKKLMPFLKYSKIKESIRC